MLNREQQKKYFKSEKGRAAIKRNYHLHKVYYQNYKKTTYWSNKIMAMFEIFKIEISRKHARKICTLCKCDTTTLKKFLKEVNETNYLELIEAMRANQALQPSV